VPRSCRSCATDHTGRAKERSRGALHWEWMSVAVPNDCSRPDHRAMRQEREVSPAEHCRHQEQEGHNRSCATRRGTSHHAPFRTAWRVACYTRYSALAMAPALLRSGEDAEGDRWLN